MDSKTLVLDSAPSVSMEIPSHIQFKGSSLYKSKSRGRPILGHQQVKYTHFVPLHESSSHIKKLLEIPESKTSTPKPIDSYKELLRTEQMEKDHGKPAPHHDMIDSDFKKEASHYVNTPKTDSLETFDPKNTEESPPITEKNDAALGKVEYFHTKLTLFCFFIFISHILFRF